MRGQLARTVIDDGLGAAGGGASLGLAIVSIGHGEARSSEGGR